MRRLAATALLLLAALPLCAQNARKDDIATQLVTQNTSAGTVSFLKPVAGAVITIGLGASPCSITNTPSGSTASCAPLAAICSSSTDVVCTQPNPTNADALGNYGFWAKPARYQVAVTGIGVNGKLITYDLPVGLSDLTDFVYLTELVLNGGTPLVSQTGTGTSIVTNIGPAITNPTISGIGPRFQQFTANGTFSIPPNVTVVKVTVVGGGGGGGGSTGGGAVGAGGGSGGATSKWLSGLTPGNTLTVTIGPGGTGVSGAAGNNGTASTVASGTQIITTVVGNAGSGGPSTAPPAGGGLGAATGTGGDIATPGNSGGPGITGNGGNGGASALGGGTTGLGTSGANAVANTGSGGAGSGPTGAPTAGGNGASGIVIFEWVI